MTKWITRLRVKICGIRGQAPLEAAINAGADAVGFVFADSPRRIELDQARRFAEIVPSFVTRVGVFLHPSAAHVAEVAREVPLDLFQSDHEDAAIFDEAGLSPRFLPVFRDSPSLAEQLLATISITALVESAKSGAGIAPDWQRIRAARSSDSPRIILAGGLTPSNVAIAVRAVRPYAVDVSSGVESGPGVKNCDLIRSFVEAVRDVEADY